MDQGSSLVLGIGSSLVQGIGSSLVLGIGSRGFKANIRTVSTQTYMLHDLIPMVVVQVLSTYRCVCTKFARMRGPRPAARVF